MTTYRKDVRKENNSLLSNIDSHIYCQNEAPDYLHALHSRVNCLVGFTVISLLIGSAALAISILLMLQAFDTMGQENARFQALQMRIKYLERLTESLEPEQNHRDSPIGVKAAPPPPPSPPPLPPHLTLPSIQPLDPETQPPLPSPHPLPPPTITPQHDREMKPEIPPGGTNDEDDTNADVSMAGRRRPGPLPPIDDEEDADADMEGSGEECPANPPRPICPMGMRLCTTRERCPKYVCCRH